MSQLLRSCILVSTLALLAAACASSAETSSPPATSLAPSTTSTALPAPAETEPPSTDEPTGFVSFSPLPCEEVVPIPAEIYSQLFADPSIECGYVAAPADWGDPDGDQIQLAVYRIPASGTDPAHDPLIYLEGGPGGSGVLLVGEFAGGSASFLREQRDVIVIDQRGTGYSVPALFCPEAGPDGVDPDGHQACRDRLVADGINPGDYNSVNNARDLTAVREALDYDEWNLYGLSYGTRLALTAMRDMPEGIRSVVLDSVFPPQINGMSEVPYTIYWTIDQIAANCEADDDCTVDAKALIEDGIERLTATPVGDLDPLAYLELLAEVMTEPQLLELLDTAATGTDEELTTLLAALADGEEEDGVPTIDAVDPEFYPLVSEAFGMGYPVVCAEEAPFLDVTAGPVLGDDFRPTTRDAVEDTPEPYASSLCSIWDVPSAGEIATQPVSSDIPTLILAGTADAATPPAWSQLAGDTLSRSTYLEFPGLPHGLLGNNDCLNALTGSFLANPDAELDQTCIADFPPVDYQPLAN